MSVSRNHFRIYSGFAADVYGRATFLGAKLKGGGKVLWVPASMNIQVDYYSILDAGFHSEKAIGYWYGVPGYDLYLPKPRFLPLSLAKGDVEAELCTRYQWDLVKKELVSVTPMYRLSGRMFVEMDAHVLPLGLNFLSVKVFYDAQERAIHLVGSVGKGLEIPFINKDSGRALMKSLGVAIRGQVRGFAALKVYEEHFEKIIQLTRVGAVRQALT